MFMFWIENCIGVEAKGTNQRKKDFHLRIPFVILDIHHEAIYEGLMILPKFKMEAVILHYWELKTDIELGQHFGVTDRTIRKWRQQSIEEMRKFVNGGGCIAGPFVLGISSGAKMAVALTMVVLLRRLGSVSSWTLVFAAFIGSLVSMGFILLLSGKLRHMAVLLVGGIMIGYICSAMTDLIVTFADDADIINLHGWSQGSFSGSSWEGVAVAAALTTVASTLVFLLSKPIGAYQLGEAYAQSMGVHVQLFRVALILLSSLLSACVTAFAGPVSFVGIAVPHLVKRGLGTAKPIIVIPAVFLGGAVFCMSCDLIARTALVPTELNISTVTSIFGAPVVIAMLIKRQKER